MQSFVSKLQTQHLQEIGDYLHQLDYHLKQKKSGSINWKDLVRFYGVSIFLLLYYVTLYIVDAPPESVWFHFDVFKMIQMQRFTNLMAAMIVLNDCRYFWLIYFCNDITITRMIGCIVLNRDFDFFQKPHNSQIINFESFAFWVWLAFFLLRVFTGSLFILAILINVLVYFAYAFPITDLTRWWNETAQSSLFTLAILFYYMWIKPFVSHCSILAYFAINMVRVFGIKIHQTRSLLEDQHHSPVYGMVRYCVLTRVMLLHLLESNRVYGHALFLFLLMQCPINTYIIMELLLKHARFAIILSLLCFEQLLAIVVIHWLFAHVNQRFRKPNKRLLALTIYHQRKLSSYTNLQLGLYLEALHTKKRYGFSYGQFGVLSLFSFFKFLLFYSEMFIFVYKIVKNIEIY